MTAPPLLSICIPTLNRGRLIGETLESMVTQLTDRVEIVIVDGGSTDNTELVVQRYAARHRQIHYIKRGAEATPSNEGFDRDCDRAVELASGRYCWLMTDDDLLAEDAVAQVLARVEQDHDLLLVCSKVCSVDFAQILVPALPGVKTDRTYNRAEWTAFVAEMGAHLTFVGRVVIKREVWLRRERHGYFGSGFVHAGVILSEPMDSVSVLAQPLVILRYGNALWTSRAFDIWMYSWPRLVWSFMNVSESARAAVTPRYPFRSTRRLMWYRALGAYSPDKYRAHLSQEPGVPYRLVALLIAHFPIALSNVLCASYLWCVRSRSIAIQMYDLVHCGHGAILTRMLARLRGVH